MPMIMMMIMTITIIIIMTIIILMEESRFLRFGNQPFVRSLKTFKT